MVQDARGRVRTPRERREKILDEYERSGMSGAAFAAMVGMKYPTLASWIQQRRRQGKQTEAAPGAVSWVEIGRGPEAEAGAMRVQIGAVVRVEVANGQQARWVGEMLRAMGVERC